MDLWELKLPLNVTPGYRVLLKLTRVCGVVAQQVIVMTFDKRSTEVASSIQASR